MELQEHCTERCRAAACQAHRDRQPLEPCLLQLMEGRRLHDSRPWTAHFQVEATSGPQTSLQTAGLLLLREGGLKIFTTPLCVAVHRQCAHRRKCHQLVEQDGAGCALTLGPGNLSGSGPEPAKTGAFCAGEAISGMLQGSLFLFPFLFLFLFIYLFVFLFLFIFIFLFLFLFLFLFIFLCIFLFFFPVLFLFLVLFLSLSPSFALSLSLSFCLSLSHTLSLSLPLPLPLSHLYIHMYKHTCIFTHVCIFVYTHLVVYLCLCFMFMFFTYLHVYPFTFIRPSLHMYMDICILCTCAYTCFSGRKSSGAGRGDRR